MKLDYSPGSTKPKSQAPDVKVPIAETPAKKVKLWNKRTEIIKKSGTMPRDFHEHSPFAVTFSNKEAEKGVRLCWISDWLRERRPMMTGYNHDLYQAVTPEVIKEFGLKFNTHARTPDGVPRAGMDAVLYWIPEEVAKVQDKILLSGVNAIDRMRTSKRKEEVKEQSRYEIGKVQEVESLEEMAQVEASQRKEVNASAKFDEIVAQETRGE